MVTPTSRFAYDDCFELMKRAMDDGKGIRIPFDKEGTARHFRMRLHSARQIDRRDNTITYNPDHPMHGRSMYDDLMVRIVHDGDTFWLHLEKISATFFTVESLSEGTPNVHNRSSESHS